MASTRVSVALFVALASYPAAAQEGASTAAAPTLEWLRECVIRRGVSARLIKIEELDPAASGVRKPGGLRRVVFWTKTRRLTQTIVIALVGDGSFIRVQSCDLARAEAAHPKLRQVMTYVLDRNFAVVGAQFARDATDGELALRADIPCKSGLSEADFMQVLESVLRTADEEAPRLWAILGKSRDRSKP